MAILGIDIDKTNPEFKKCDFLFWMPQYSAFMDTQEGEMYFNKLYALANDKIFYSIFGVDWERAMSLAIGHYLRLISKQVQTPSGSSLQSIAGGGTPNGILTSVGVGGFSKSYDLDKSMLSNDEAKWWNLTPEGSELMALLKTKPIPSIFVATSNPVPYTNKPWPPKPRDEEC